MKAKLIKHKFGYNLVDTNGEFIATSKDEYSNGINLKYWLSKQNCDEIFGVVDVEKLAESEFENSGWTQSYPEHMKEDFIEIYNGGFEKAMELNKEKLFTLEDMENCWDANFDYYRNDGKDSGVGFQMYIQSLQQPTEIEVEIVTLIDYFDSSNKLYLSTDEAAKYCTDTGIPYTDSEGNLILIKL
jgi:hypothetical protein